MSVLPADGRRWLLCDYGEVLSLPLDEQAIVAMSRCAGIAVEPLLASYWHHRLPYDRGDVTAAAFWTAVLGRSAPDALIEELVALDISGWTRPNPDALAGVAALAERGWRLAILSNAPREIARHLDGVSWLTGFAPRLFSCDLGEVKPEPAAFAAALAALGVPASVVTFVDDRETNIAGARAAGLVAHRYRSAALFSALAAQ
jgi:putative hydrolase of the HAD superfamily